MQAQHRAFVLTDAGTVHWEDAENVTGRIVARWAGAFVGPPGDPHNHFHPFGRTAVIPEDIATELEPEEPAAKPRPAGIPVGAKRSKSTPSRSPEARHAEYERAKARRRREAQRY